MKLKYEMTQLSSVGSRYNHGGWSVLVAQPPHPHSRQEGTWPSFLHGLDHPALAPVYAANRPGLQTFTRVLIAHSFFDLRATQEFRQWEIFSSRKILFNLFS